MQAQYAIRSLVLAVLIATGTVLPSPTGEVKERQVDLVKSLFVAPVSVTGLDAHG
ncbi:hypothetical protein [Roseovarius sp. 2305UL8-3]|uniref:hypothetical protein n=1 Tax=Roseovarius conchicola TaxID=3121636 RepID=UPI0035297D1B